MLEQAAADLVGSRISTIEHCASGGNSRVYRVEDKLGRLYALKSYPSLDLDPRDRLGTEYAALEFLRRDERLHVPKPLAVDRTRLLALYSWVDGSRPTVTASIIDAMLDFIRITYQLREIPEASMLPLASECCLSGSEILRQVHTRLGRLRSQADEIDLQKFLTSQIEPLLDEMILEDTVLTPELRCLNPGDFGAHNMLVVNGVPAFIDMEYFGWDDPVKQVCDVLWHPAMSLEDDLVVRFLEGATVLYSHADSDFVDRVRRYFVAYGLRWIMIVLNEFLSVRWAVRTHAGAVEQNNAKRRQLCKAQAIFNSMTSRQTLVNNILKKNIT